MTDQCKSCGGFCKKSGCERENTRPMTTEELIAEIKNLKAYAKHERSLAAEKYTQQIHDLNQENDSLIAENDRLSDFWSQMRAERDEYQRAADDMAAAHKVERDALMARLEAYESR